MADQTGFSPPTLPGTSVLGSLTSDSPDVHINKTPATVARMDARGDVTVAGAVNKTEHFEIGTEAAVDAADVATIDARSEGGCSATSAALQLAAAEMKIAAARVAAALEVQEAECAKMRAASKVAEEEEKELESSHLAQNKARITQKP